MCCPPGRRAEQRAEQRQLPLQAAGMSEEAEERAAAAYYDTLRPARAMTHMPEQHCLDPKAARDLVRGDLQRLTTLPSFIAPGQSAV